MVAESSTETILTVSDIPYGLIYCILNRETGKRYIGQTINTLKKRWKEHVKAALKRRSNYHLAHSIRKYGAKAFDIIEIDRADSKKELDYLESYWIKFFNSTDRSSGYNSTTGGEGGRQNLEVRERMCLIKRRQIQERGGGFRKGIKLSPEDLEAYRWSKVKRFIRCIETGEVFISARAAGLLLNMDIGCIWKSLHRTEQGNPYVYRGYTWEFVSKDSVPASEVSCMASKCVYDSPLNVPPPPIHKVKCVETGQVWERVSLAAKHFGVDRSAIRSSIKRPNGKSCGLTFVYTN